MNVKKNRKIIICSIISIFVLVAVIIGMNINELSMDFSIRGRFVTKIIKMIQKSNDEEEKNILQNALKLGMQCLSEEEVSLNDY